MEVWRQVALRMSTPEMAKGLVQTCKALRHLSTSAICLTLGSGMRYRSDYTFSERTYLHACCQGRNILSVSFGLILTLQLCTDNAIDWARRRWVLATKLCLKTSRATDSRLMSWVAFNSKELGPLSQLAIITDAHIIDGRHHAAAAVAAMAAILAHQVGLAQCLHTDAANADSFPSPEHS